MNPLKWITNFLKNILEPERDPSTSVDAQIRESTLHLEDLTYAAETTRESLLLHRYLTGGDKVHLAGLLADTVNEIEQELASLDLLVAAYAVVDAGGNILVGSYNLASLTEKVMGPALGSIQAAKPVIAQVRARDTNKNT